MFPSPPLWAVVGAPGVTVGKEPPTHRQWIESFGNAGLRRRPIARTAATRNGGLGEASPRYDPLV